MSHTAQTDARTGHVHITPSDDPLGLRTRIYTHTSPVTGSALLRRASCDLLTTPDRGEPYVVRFRGHAYESSIIFLTPNQLVPLPVPTPETATDWATTLTDTLVEHLATGQRSYFSHVGLDGRPVLFADGRTSRTAHVKDGTFPVPVKSVRIVKED
jgi:hypothetical protein